MEDQQVQRHHLDTEQHKHRINANTYPCIEWDSNPRSQSSSGRRRFMPQTVRPLCPAVRVILLIYISVIYVGSMVNKQNRSTTRRFWSSSSLTKAKFDVHSSKEKLQQTLGTDHRDLVWFYEIYLKSSEVEAPTFSDILHTDCDKVVSPTRRPFYLQEDSWYSFLLEAESISEP
jgi:hypothetical protein